MSAECRFQMGPGLHRFLLTVLIEAVWMTFCKAKITAKITDRADTSGYYI